MQSEGRGQDAVSREGGGEARFEAAPWDAHATPELPVSTGADQSRIAANVVRSAMSEGGVELLGVRCLTICENRFNDLLEARRSKAAVAGEAVTALMLSSILFSYPTRPY